MMFLKSEKENYGCDWMKIINHVAQTDNVFLGHRQAGAPLGFQIFRGHRQSLAFYHSNPTILLQSSNFQENKYKPFKKV